MRRSKRILLAAVPIGAAFCAGCVSPRAEPSVALEAQDFVDPDAPARPTVSLEERPASTWTNSRGEVAASEGIVAVQVRPGPPTIDLDNVDAAEAPVVVDAKVGDVSGKAIYASQFFEPFDAQLRATAAEVDRRKWITDTRTLIQRELHQQITDELIKDEAYESLSPQQRQGLRFLLQEIQETARKNQGGSIEALSRMLSNQTGQTVDEFVKQRSDEELIKYQLSQVYKNVHVSFQDIELQYERDYDRWNPDPKAVFLRIYAGANNQSSVDAISTALASGTPFEEVAALEANILSRDLGRQEIQFTGEYSEQTFFGTKEHLNDAARALSEGEWVGPIDDGSRMVWLQLAELDDRTTSLYDAQITIADEIRQQRLLLAQYNYVRKLMERANFTDTEEMTNRLLQFAIRRYLPADQG